LIESLLSVLFKKYIYILALEMASRGNQRCANCIGTLLFPVSHVECVVQRNYTTTASTVLLSINIY